jgi:hypothetical protein
MTAASALGASRRRVVSNLTAGGVPIPSGWALQRLDTFGTSNSVPGPVRMHSLYSEAATWNRDADGRAFIPNAVINNQQQTYQHFEDSTFSFMSDRLRIQGRGQGDNSIKSGQLVSHAAYRSFLYEALITVPGTLGTWMEFWAYGSNSGNDSSELDVEILASMDGSFLTTHSVTLQNHGAFAAPIIDDSHVVYNAGGFGLTIYTNAAFDYSTGPHYYTIYYDDTGAGETRRYIDGALMYHCVGKWNSSLGGTGFGPDAALLLDLAVGSGASGGNFPGTVTSPSTWSGNLDIYSVGVYAPGAAGRAIPAAQAWSTFRTPSIALSGGDLVATGTAIENATVFALDAMYSGKYYWEVVLSSNGAGAGVGGTGNFRIDTYLGDFGAGVAWYGSGPAAGTLIYQGATLATWGTYSGTPVRLCFALHIVPGTTYKLWGRVGAAGNWCNDVIANQNPATDTGGVALSFTGDITPAGAVFNPGDTATMVAASASWVGTPPAGFGQIGPT